MACGLSRVGAFCVRMGPPGGANSRRFPNLPIRAGTLEVNGLTCSLGLLTKVGSAAVPIGVVLGSVWNFALSSKVVWGRYQGGGCDQACWVAARNDRKWWNADSDWSVSSALA